MPDTSKQRATGHINVTSYESKPFDISGPFTISEAMITEEFSGGLLGAGSLRLVVVTAPDESIHFAGMEKFLGKLGERSGSFLFENRGTMKDGVLQSWWKIIPGSGTEALEGLCGEGGCDPGGYALDYWFE
jgi:hypothetical protein